MRVLVLFLALMIGAVTLTACGPGVPSDPAKGDIR